MCDSDFCQPFLPAIGTLFWAARVPGELGQDQPPPPPPCEEGLEGYSFNQVNKVNQVRQEE